MSDTPKCSKKLNKISTLKHLLPIRPVTRQLKQQLFDLGSCDSDSESNVSFLSTSSVTPNKSFDIYSIDDNSEQTPTKMSGSDLKTAIQFIHSFNGNSEEYPDFRSGCETALELIDKDFKSTLLKFKIMKAGRGDSTLKIQKITSLDEVLKFLDETFLKTETIHSLISEMQIIK